MSDDCVRTWFLANEARFSIYDDKQNFAGFDAEAMLRAFYSDLNKSMMELVKRDSATPEA